MNDKEFFYRVLGLDEPWLVEEVKLDLGGKKVEVRVAVTLGTKWGEDGKLLPIAGYEERDWRHLKEWGGREELPQRAPLRIVGQ